MDSSPLRSKAQIDKLQDSAGFRRATFPFQLVLTECQPICSFLRSDNETAVRNEDHADVFGNALVIMRDTKGTLD
jgi:hypothetical protein